MKTKKILTTLLAVAMVLSSTACFKHNKTESNTSVTASEEMEKCVSLFEERVDIMPDSLVLAAGDDAVSYGVDVSEFMDDEGFTVRANTGDVVILGKTVSAVDRGVRYFTKYGNYDNYSFTYGEGYRVKHLTIAGNDISEYVIVYENDGYNGYLHLAAKELSNYIEKTCGAVVPAYSAGDIKKMENPPARQINLTVDYPTLGSEAFRIEVGADGNMTIFGGRVRGCLYGVYDLLEENVGWRFFDDVLCSYNPENKGGMEYLYEAELVELTEEINRTEEPLFLSRRQDDNYESSANLANKEKISANWYSGHGLNQVDYTGTSFEGKEHTGVQPCLTDEEILKRIDEHTLAYVKRALDSGQEIGRDFFGLSLGQYDNAGGYCLCEECMKVVAEERSGAGLYVRTANRAAQLLKDNGYGDVHVNILAYDNTDTPPAVTKPLDNVRVAFCFYISEGAACNVHTIDGKDCDPKAFNSNTRLAEKFEGWVDICAPGALDVWYYPFQAGSAITAAPMVTNLYYDIKYLADHDVGAIINTTFSHMSESQLGALVAYLLNEICWELPESFEEYQRMIEEWFHLTYGDGGAPLYEYFLEYERLGKFADCYAAFYSTTSPLEYINVADMASRFDYFCGLFEKAKRLADTRDQFERIERLEAGMLFLGVSHAYDAWYVNGTEDEKKKLIERYKELHRIVTEYDLHIYAEIVRENVTYAPTELNLDENPIMWYITALENRK